MRLGAVLLAVISIGAGATLALACSPPIPSPPPPPRVGVGVADAAALEAAWIAAQKTLLEERKRQGTADAQRNMFERAGAVFLARLDSITEAQSVLAPVEWIKGARVVGGLTLAQTTWTTCGPIVSENGVYGQPGEVFIVYLKGDALLQAETLNVLPISRVVDPQTLERLSAALIGPRQ